MDGQWWRLVTAGFLHGGVLHILMNSWVLFDLGAEVETFYGTSRLIVFYFVSTVTGFAASSHINGGHFSVGSSAGIFGLIGAMLAFGFTDRSSLGMQVKIAVYALGDLRIGVELPGAGVRLERRSMGARGWIRGRIPGRMAGQHASRAA